MDDTVTDTPIEQSEPRSIPPDAFAAALSLIALAADPRAFKKKLQGLHRALTAVDEGMARLAADQAAFAAYEQQTREELTAQAAKLREGQVALATKKDWREDDLLQREKRIRELEDLWRFVGEEDDVKRGFRASEFSTLMKAKAAYGYTSDHGLDDIAKAMADKFPSRTVRHDNSGLVFPESTTLTRQEPAPPAAVRVRPSRRSAA